MLNPSLAGQFAALDLSGGGTVTGNLVVSGTLRTTNLGVGLAPDTTRIHMLSQAADTTPTDFTADDFVVGRSALTGASSGAVFARYDSTHSAGFLGSLSPGTAWRNLIIGAATTIFQNASGVAKLTTPGTGTDNLNLSNVGILGWSSTADATVAADTTIARSAAGTITTGKIVTTGLVGTTTNDNAATGCVGQIIESVVVSTTVGSWASNTPQNITSVSLTAGDWTVDGLVTWVNGATPVSGGQYYALSSTSSASFGSVDDGYRTADIVVLGAGNQLAQVIPLQRFSLASTTTVYLIGAAGSVSATLTAGGRITARRMR